MPSFQWLKPFSKKKAHGGNKFHDYHHGYDNLRHSSYPATPPSMMGQQHQYTQAPPHSFSHRQHLYPQQLIMQSPPPPVNQLNQPQHQFQHQVITTTANNSNGPLASANHQQCQCNQCSFQQPQLSMQVTNSNHQVHNPQHQLVQHQQTTPAPSLAQAQTPIIDSHMPIISPPPQQQQQQQPQQQQQVPQQQTQHVQIPQLQHQHAHQQCQHVHQPNQVQQPVYQCQNSFVHNGYVNQSFTSNTIAPMPQSPPQTFSQCSCQHCPYQQQQQSLSSQQQFMQQLDQVQTNGTCQHQMTNTVAHSGAGPNVTQQMTHLQSNPHNHMQQQQQQQTCQSHITQQNMPAIMTSSTPGAQSQQLIHHSSTVSPPQQFQYHTIQPAHYQQQKQQMQHQQMQQQQQQQQHQRVQSLHHQQTQPIQQLTHQSLQGAPHLAQSQSQLNYQDHSHQPEAINQPQQCRLESGAHDYSRYANMQSLIDNTHNRTDYSRQSRKYQEHVYYNQKPELPPYEPPPDYETFIEHRKMYAVELSGQHMTHHSESLVFQKAKDSSYENLRTKSSLYSNLCISRQEPGYTS